MTATPRSSRRDEAGFLPLEGYGAIGEGRSVALTGEDGGIDWWCVPNMDSPPLFDRLLIGSGTLPDGSQAGHFSITPTQPFRTSRTYRPGSNVLETRFVTDDAEAVLTESLNSGTAGRLPWAELARRIEMLRGTMEFAVTLRFGHRAGRRSPYMSPAGPHVMFHVGAVLGAFLHGERLAIAAQGDGGIRGTLTIPEGGREVLAIVAGADEPLVIPDLAAIDARIDGSDREWRDWSALFNEDGFVMRQALALKLLLYSPSGAIAAAATSSLPERIGGDKNYDYRFAWVRDAGYSIVSFLQMGAEAEAKAALTWLLRQLCEHGTRVCFLLDGGTDGEMREFDLPGYRGSRPVVQGNRAADQHQHGIYGDIFETVAAFTRAGNIIDARSAETLSHLADECADRWRQKDSGIWELPEERHYTMSKISCWQALSRAVELADAGHLPTTCRDRWNRERTRIAEWIDATCWDEARRAYVMYPGSDRLDASIALAVRFGFDGQDRLALTLDAIDRELGTGGLHYRYGGMEQEEGCFLACSFWMVEARALLGQTETARDALARLKTICGDGILPEMIDPSDHRWLGNLPQGLSHLAALQAAVAVQSGTSVRRQGL
ncbi:glycoside hydrolase family 15 protein [Falsirhodobacter xinxiangensis]|uniref:glycoside hydrolase family 15 protein n=1 Tax=Falsirhodobacter xinxiangensis TaxID=2530049 RepID=UPI0010AB48A3|nr:glycoside hydrolase family 15 protein [Rhodobacter xinxiangensis]